MYRFLIFIVFILIANNMSAQQHKIWMDVEIEYNMRLNDWFDNREIDKYLSQNMSLGIKGRLNLILKKEFGIFGEMTLHPILKKQSEMNINMLNEFDLDNFYIKQKYFHSRDQNNSFELSGMLGLFYKTKYKKWNIIPYLGFGLKGYPIPALSYTLKEKGSSNMYSVASNYHTLDDNKSDVIPYFSLQTIFSYPISEKFSLNIGLNYGRHLSRLRFSHTISDYYSWKTISEIRTRGNIINTLGLSAGISF